MISIIIPVYNEKQNMTNIQKMLHNLEGEFEVIFCDGCSQDGTAHCIEPGYEVVLSDKGRAVQMNAGYVQSSGDILLFLHCDAMLEPKAVNKIEQAVKNGVRAGCLSLSFDGGGWLMDVCAFMSNLRTKVRQIMFGDQGIFIERSLFEELGQFPKLPLMEDYELSIRLKKKKIPVKQIHSRIQVSARRYQKNGIIRTMWLTQKMQILYLLGKDVNKLAQKYKDVR